MIHDVGVISTKRTFKGYGEEHKMIKLVEYISLSEGKTISSSSSVDWTKSFDRNNIPHRKQGYLESKNELFCSSCVEKRKMIYIRSEMEIACYICSNLITQKNLVYGYQYVKNKTSKRASPNASLVCRNL